ncbi:hypothetical protein [Tropicimonas aquimaris]|uniref:Lipoprotein n=1 Tax=Tropicimonas aquimaris TaxID=914152 RepID=A0ABW3IQN3_9RHOB
MKPNRFMISALLVGGLLAGCTSTTPPDKNGGTEQLRSSMTRALRNADVPDACIAILSRQTLVEVKAITDQSARSSIGVLQQRQQIQTAARRDCGDF